MSMFRDDLDEFARLSRAYSSEVRKRKDESKKVVCYYGSRVPVEIIHASGAVQYPLFDGGDTGPAEAALPYLLAFCQRAGSVSGWPARAGIKSDYPHSRPYYHRL